MNLLFLYPNDVVAAVCYQLSQRKEERRDFRLSDTDLVHLGYVLAHEMDYFLTTDKGEFRKTNQSKYLYTINTII